MDIPTREELYAFVDRKFRDTYPMAPLKLSRSGEDDEWYRDRWLEIRDEHLKDEVNRIYWERFPECPLQIDPENPDHNPFMVGWLEIRDAIMSSAPLPLDDDDDELDSLDIDMSYVRAEINDGLVRLLPMIDPDHHESLREYFDETYEEIRAAAVAGSIVPGRRWGDGAKALTVPTAEERYPHHVHLYAYWDGDVLRGMVWDGPDWGQD